MYGNSNARNGWMPENLPHLPTYEKALAHWEAVRPYSKGADQGKRPLGEKRRYSRSIIRKVHQLTGDDAIVLSYYNNDVVRLYPNGSKKFSICGYPSISTTHVLNETSRTDNLHFTREKGKIYAVYKGTFYCMPTTGYVEISASGEIAGYEHECQHTIRFDVMKALKEKYGPFTTFVRDMLTINPYVSVNQQFGLVVDQPFTDRLADLRYMPVLKSHMHERTSKTATWQFFNLLDDALLEKQEPMLERFYFIAHKFFESVMLDRGVHPFYRAYPVHAEVPAEQAIRHFNELLKYRFAKEVFEKKHIAPRGKPVHDSNKHYFTLCF